MSLLVARRAEILPFAQDDTGLLLCLAAERSFKFGNYAVGYAMLYIGFTRRKCRVFNFIILQRL